MDGIERERYKGRLQRVASELSNLALLTGQAQPASMMKLTGYLGLKWTFVNTSVIEKSQLPHLAGAPAVLMEMFFNSQKSPIIVALNGIGADGQIAEAKQRLREIRQQMTEIRQLLAEIDQNKAEISQDKVEFIRKKVADIRPQLVELIQKIAEKKLSEASIQSSPEALLQSAEALLQSAEARKGIENGNKVGSIVIEVDRVAELLHDNLRTYPALSKAAQSKMKSTIGLDIAQLRERLLELGELRRINSRYKEISSSVDLGLVYINAVLPKFGLSDVLSVGN